LFYFFHFSLFLVFAVVVSGVARHGNVDFGLNLRARPFLGVGVAAFAMPKMVIARAGWSSAKAPAWVREQE
jgi:hypothetical protein